MQRNPRKVDVKGCVYCYRPPLVYAIVQLSGSGSPDFKGHSDLSNGIRYPQKPYQSTQHMWNIWIWHQEQWKWPKNKGISLKTLQNSRRNLENHIFRPFNPFKCDQICSETISVDSTHLKYFHLLKSTTFAALLCETVWIYSKSKRSFE